MIAYNFLLFAVSSNMWPAKGNYAGRERYLHRLIVTWDIFLALRNYSWISDLPLIETTFLSMGVGAVCITHCLHPNRILFVCVAFASVLCLRLRLTEEWSEIESGLGKREIGRCTSNAPVQYPYHTCTIYYTITNHTVYPNKPRHTIPCTTS